MDSHASRWARLPVEIPAVALDPLTRQDIAPHRLVAGVLVEDPLTLLAAAERDGLDEVVVRTRDPDGWTGLERVPVRALRKAFPALADGSRA